mgnify:CR=1 FL=1
MMGALAHSTVLIYATPAIQKLDMKHMSANAEAARRQKNFRSAALT